MEKISIITVTFNCEKVIERTIQSCISQTYSNFEYIIIDGGSTDGTVDIIKKYSDRISYWISEPDKGIYDAMNKGVEYATGDWIIFMNAGDLFASNKILSIIFNNFVNDSNVGFIYGDYALMRNGYVKIEKIKIPFWKSLKYVPPMGICHQSVFTKTTLARRYRFNLKYKICADYDMLYQIYRAGYTQKYINAPLAIFDFGNGISVNNPYIVYKEEADIWGVKRNMRFYRYYAQKRLKASLHRYIKKILSFFSLSALRKVQQKKGWMPLCEFEKEMLNYNC